MNEIGSSFSVTLRGFVALILAAAPSMALDVTMATGTQAPLVGQAMTVTGSASGTAWYRFRVRTIGGDYRTIRDYGPPASLDWAADREGAYELEVSAKNPVTGEIATTSQIVHAASRIQNGRPAVNATEHPLVFLFSAPGCAAGGRMRIQFQTSSGAAQYTPFKPCTPAASMNFYLAGLYPQTIYSATAILDAGTSIERGAAISFQTSAAPAFSWSESVIKPYPADASQPILLATTGGSQVATDLTGRTVWFNPSPQSYATKMEAGGFLWGFLEDGTKPVEQQGIRKVDLVGRTVLETNAARVNEQLMAMGKRQISAFHHDVRTLPDGRIAALASVEQMLTDVQGPGAVDVIGDMIVVFDQNLNVVWTWDTFDHLDTTRLATMGETCAPVTGGCPPFYLATTANDWTHGNAVQQTPDGNLLYSCRHQDWLIKIAYENGEGDGHILWRLGRDGDFTYLSDDPFPWFSHQHDGNFVSAKRIAVFDNGNVRVVQNDGNGNSRGQVIELDEENRTATLILNADLGVLSTAVGSAQRLRDGNYHFDAGYVSGPNGLVAYALEVDSAGQIVGSLEGNALLYRSFRLTDLYTPN